MRTLINNCCIRLLWLSGYQLALMVNVAGLVLVRRSIWASVAKYDDEESRSVTKRPFDIAGA